MDDRTAAELTKYAHKFLKGTFRLQSADREDLVQEALLKLVPRFQMGAVRFPKTLVQKALLSAAVDRFRQQKRQNLSGGETPYLNDLIDERAPSSEEIVLSREVCARLGKKMCLLLRLRIAGYTEAEIAKRIGCSQPVIHEARKKLMRKLLYAAQ